MCSECWKEFSGCPGSSSPLAQDCRFWLVVTCELAWSLPAPYSFCSAPSSPAHVCSAMLGRGRGPCLWGWTFHCPSLLRLSSLSQPVSTALCGCDCCPDSSPPRCCLTSQGLPLGSCTHPITHSYLFSSFLFGKRLGLEICFSAAAGVGILGEGLP